MEDSPEYVERLSAQVEALTKEVADLKQAVAQLQQQWGNFTHTKLELHPGDRVLPAPTIELLPCKDV